VNGSTDFLAGGGEMGRRMREFDWSKTSLGPVAEWPQSLRSAVSILLPSKAQIVLFWGKELATLYNDAYRPVFGAKHPQVLGLPAREAWSEIWETGLRDLFEGVLRTGEAFWASDRLFVIERFGYPEETYFDVSYDPVRDESGRVGGIFCIVTETTGRVVGERRLRTLRELGIRTTEGAKSAAEACRNAAESIASNPHDLPFGLIYLLDGDERTARLAGAAGLADESLAAMPVVDLMAPPADGLPWPLRRVLETGRAEVVSGLGQRLDPTPDRQWPEPPHSAVVLPIVKSGQDRLAGFLVAGVSPRRPLDEHSRGFLDLLASQIATAIASAVAYEEERRRAQALYELDRAKTAFFSNVSHEFRTPLTLMLGPVEDLLARSHTDLPPAAAGQLEVVNRNGLRLLRLVNTLLDFSRIEAGRVRATYQATDLATFTVELASVFRAAVERAGLHLTVDCPPLGKPVFVDRDMWEKIVLNLLSNAFKFTFAGEIVVTLRQVDGAAALRVRDSGTGIPPEEIARLFERFHRVENARGRTHEGSGIGLALVQELAKLHGGAVTVESVVGEGSTFAVTIPLGTAHLPSDQIGESRPTVSTVLGAGPYVEEALRWLPDDEHPEDALGGELPSHLETLAVPALQPEREEDDRPLVLVADDNADMRQYLFRLLAERYRVRTVADGEAALAAVREQLPRLVLTDVMMPRLDGFGLLRELRADPRMRDLPVIMLSARAGEESRVEGLQAGADDYLIKPFSARELLARVQSSLELARVRGEAEQASRRRGAQFKTLLDQAPLGVYLVDADFRVREVNPIARLAFGDIPGGLIGRDFDEVIHVVWAKPYADEIVRIFRRTLETGEPYTMPEHAEVRVDRGITEYYEWRVDRIPLADGRSGVVCYFRDISAQVLARHAIEESREALRQADRRKDEFLATLAHELRNPLAPMRNGLELMKLAQSDGEGIERARTLIERQLGQMVRLVDDLLDLSRISRGTVELRRARVPLAAVVRQAVETSQPAMEAAGHALTLEVPEEPIIVNADDVRLAQAVANLLHNAAKYTEPGGRIRLAVARAGAEAVVMVEDNGVGMSPDMLPKVFEMFTQVDRSLERSQGGLGIGLAIVKRLVEMHGGSVEAYSAGVGQGSRFTVRLPVARPVSGGEPERREARFLAAPVRRRILVVDDNEDSAMSMALLLTGMGNETRTAHEGLEALEVGATFLPEIILLDIGMPRLNGYETARRIREQPWGQSVKLVAVTGWGQEADRRRSQEAGFDHHLVKPVDPAALSKLLG
jgi:PAS domain S-box-containing protein